MPNPSLRQRLRNLASFSRPLAWTKGEREPNFVACASPIYPLQNELEVEGLLKFANHDDGWIITPQRQQIAATDLTFDNEAEPFEKGLNRPIEQRLQNGSPRFVPNLSQASVVLVYNL
jgi:hypothetical protein